VAAERPEISVLEIGYVRRSEIGQLTIENDFFARRFGK
jgi:hypothetical protein